MSRIGLRPDFALLLRRRLCRLCGHRRNRGHRRDRGVGRPNFLADSAKGRRSFLTLDPQFGAAHGAGKTQGGYVRELVLGGLHGGDKDGGLCEVDCSVLLESSIYAVMTRDIAKHDVC